MHAHRWRHQCSRSTEWTLLKDQWAGLSLSKLSASEVAELNYSWYFPLILLKSTQRALARAEKRVVRAREAHTYIEINVFQFPYSPRSALCVVFFDSCSQSLAHHYSLLIAFDRRPSPRDRRNNFQPYRKIFFMSFLCLREQFFADNSIAIRTIARECLCCECRESAEIRQKKSLTTTHRVCWFDL